MSGPFAIIQSKSRKVDFIVAMSSLKQSLPRYLCICVFEYAADDAESCFTEMLNAGKVSVMLWDADADTLCGPSYFSAVRQLKKPDLTATHKNQDQLLENIFGVYDTRLVQFQLNGGISHSSSFRVFSEIGHMAILSDDCFVSSSTSSFDGVATMRALWNFMAGGAVPPELRDALAVFADPRRADLDVMIELIRRDLRQKAARWCSMRECAALARVKFG